MISEMNNAEKTLIVVGGGFAGVSLVRHLHASLPTNWQLVLISEESYTTFNPMLPEAVGASIFPEHVVAPLREVVMPRLGRRFVMGRVSAIDAQKKTVCCQTLNGEICLGYDELVLAFGNRARLDFIPGMAEHALPLKTVGDAMQIRNMMLRRLAQIELEEDATKRKLLGSFVVIGGGFSGVEVAGEMAGCLHSIRRYYPKVQMDEVQITVVQDQNRLLLELPESLGVAAQASLEKDGVKILLAERAQSVDANGISLVSGQRVDGATVVCTIGTRPNALLEQLSVQLNRPLERGRLPVAADMSVPADITEGNGTAHSGIWAIGDCALVPNAFDNSLSPPTAQFAGQQGKQLAENLRAHIAGRETRPFRYQPRGMLAAIGHRRGVAQIFGVKLTGLPAWLLWRAFYLLQAPTLGRKVRIFVEWTWGLFFPADITHLRYNRSQDWNEHDSKVM